MSSNDASHSAAAAFLRSAPGGWALAVTAVGTLTALAQAFLSGLDATNIAMLYLLLVVVLAVRHSRNAAVVAAVSAVLAFDFFFVPPRLSFAVSHIQYLVTFAVMLGVGLIAAHLTAGVRRQAQLAAARARAANALHRFGGTLAACVEESRLAEAVEAFFAGHGASSITVWVNDRHGLRQLSARDVAPQGSAPMDVRAALAASHPVALDETCSTDSLRMLWPLHAPMRQRGVLALTIERDALDADMRGLFEAAALLIAITVERLHYVAVAHEATLEMEKEKLRATILSALSHDVRTPLTVLVGMADALATTEQLPQRERAMAHAMHAQSLKLSRLTGNLLELARLQSGRAPIRKEWQSVEEIVGAALAYLHALADDGRIVTDLPANLPLVEFDAVLIERVLCNLLENALRHCPPGAAIRLAARALDEALEFCVEDEGPGLDDALLADLFQPFGEARIERRSGMRPGGLGLAICKAIVDAHQGHIRAENRAEGGARFIVTLPRREAPRVEAEIEADTE